METAEGLEGRRYLGSNLKMAIEARKCSPYKWSMRMMIPITLATTFAYARSFAELKEMKCSIRVNELELFDDPR